MKNDFNISDGVLYISDGVIELADQGKSLIFISSEIEEMLRTCSKLVVLRDGQEVGEITEELTQGHVMQSIAGGGRNE